MQMTADARAWLHATVRRILARHSLAEGERAAVTYELMGHLHAVAEERAAAAGRSEVTREDVEAAFVKAGGDEGLAGAFVQPAARPGEPASVGARAGAFLVDAILLGVALMLVHGAVSWLVVPLGGPAPVMTPGDDPSWRDTAWVAPWAYHDPLMPYLAQAAVAVASAALVLGYFAVFEAAGGSLGKRVLDLRVVRVDGRSVSTRDAFVRNVVKLVPLLLLLDALLLLAGAPGRRQRGSDRLAGTEVVRA